MDLTRIAFNGLIIAAFSVLPLVIMLFSIKRINNRRRNLLIILFVFLGVWIFVLFLTVSSTLFIFRKGFPHIPFIVGMSIFSVYDLIKGLYIIVSLPVILVFFVLKIFKKQPSFGFITSIYVLLLYFFLYTFMLGLGFSHENTVYTKGFSPGKFDKITKNMTKEEVYAVLGEPLQDENVPDLPEGEEKLYYARNSGAGYWAIVWLKDGKVVKSRCWFED